MSPAGVAERARARLIGATRTELLSVERLEERARLLARTYVVDPPFRGRRANLVRRFHEDVRVLARAYEALTSDVRAGIPISAAGEWLLDNFHVITAEARQARHHLPRSYSRELPTLVARADAGEPRIYALATSWCVTATAGSMPSSSAFLNSYQTVAPLTIGELWAWPSMLKLALVENLRTATTEVLDARGARQAADAEFTARHTTRRSADWPATLHPAHLMQLLHRLREYTPWRGDVQQAVERHLSSHQLTQEDVIRAEHQRQAADQVSVANAITSLRLSRRSTGASTSSRSVWSSTLQRDPAGAYGRMDFLSRDRQRQAVEELARPSGDAQVRVASSRSRALVRRARASPADRAAHVGYHLIDRGRATSRPTSRIAAARRRLAQTARAPCDADLPRPDRRADGPLRRRERGVRPPRRRATRRRLSSSRCCSRSRRPTSPSQSSSGSSPGSSRRAVCRASISSAASRTTPARWSSCRRC